MSFYQNIINGRILKWSIWRIWNFVCWSSWPIWMRMYENEKITFANSMLFLSAFFWRLFFWSFQFIHHFKHLHASVFHLKGCVCQRNFGCISLRLMLYAPPMSLLKSACKRQICWCGRDSTLRVQSIKKSPQTQSYQGFASFWAVVPVAGLEPARHRWRWILSYLLHTEYKRTQTPMEVVNGHLKARNY